MSREKERRWRTRLEAEGFDARGTICLASPASLSRWSRGVARWFRWGLSVADPFVCRCLTSSAMLPFPHPAHR